tara:strand:- start:2040 stop:3356 length:1317 start_codon:yes stop_codon:yes gene_type:complete
LRKLFIHHIRSNNLFLKKDKLLLAVSGGVDSVVLCHLLAVEGYEFEIAHCNFKLRDLDSDKDEVFVKNLAKKYNVSFHAKKFSTKMSAKKNKTSIQMEARDLRYKWLRKIMKQINAKYILTAHHKNDSVETFLINIIRGTGVRGLLGIQNNEFLIRPLLFATKEELISYSVKEKLRFRIDSSNFSNKYVRNQLRNLIIPKIEEINPNFQETVLKEQKIFSFIYKFYLEQIDILKKNILTKKNKDVLINLKIIRSLNSPEPIVYEILKCYGFRSAIDITNAFFGRSGSQFFSPTHRLLIDRDSAIITPLSTNGNHKLYFIDKNEINPNLPIIISFSASNKIKFNKENQNIASLDFDKLTFPLTLRKWRSGDRFIPLGMKNFKKLSDFFIDLKIPRNEKESIWLLCSQKDIVWIVGYRIDDRFKIKSNTKKMYIATYFNS